MSSQAAIRELEPVPDDIRCELNDHHYRDIEAAWEKDGTRYVLVREEYAVEYMLLEEREDSWFVAKQTVSGRRLQCGTGGHKRQAKQRAVRFLRDLDAIQ